MGVVLGNAPATVNTGIPNVGKAVAQTAAKSASGNGWMKITAPMLCPCDKCKGNFAGGSTMYATYGKLYCAQCYNTHIVAVGVPGLSLPGGNIPPRGPWARVTVKKKATCEHCGASKLKGDLMVKHLPSWRTFRCLDCDRKHKNNPKGTVPKDPTWKYGGGAAKRPPNWVPKAFRQVVHEALTAPPTKKELEKFNFHDLGPCPETEQCPCFGTPRYEERVAPLLKRWQDGLINHFTPVPADAYFIIWAENKYGGKELSVRMFYKDGISASFAERVKKELPKKWEELKENSPPPAEKEENEEDDGGFDDIFFSHP